MKMININLFENSEYPLDENLTKHKEEILYIGAIIKKKLGLRKNPFTISDDSLRVGFISGSVLLNNVHINIWPKIYLDKSSIDNNDLKKIYYRVFETCGKNFNKTIYLSKYKSVNELDRSFIDAIAEQFVVELENATKRIKITNYETKIEQRSSIRGRVLIQKELRDPIIRPKTWCKYKELVEDNDSNRLLLWCCRFLIDLISESKLKQRLNKLILQFSGVNETKLSVNNVRNLKVARQYQIYNRCIQIAKDLFFNNYNTQILNPHEGRVSGYVINMEKAFENIVSVYADLAAKKLGVMYKPQSEKRLANSSTGGEYFVRPDGIVTSQQSTTIIDAKYKLQTVEGAINKSKPIREDFYQMIATCIAYNTNEAILIYPEIYGSNKCEHCWELDNTINGDKLNIISKQIDMIAPKNLLENKILDILSESNCIKSRCTDDK